MDECFYFTEFKFNEKPYAVFIDTKNRFFALFRY